MSWWTDVRDTITAPVRAVGSFIGDVFSGKNIFDSLGQLVGKEISAIGGLATLPVTATPLHDLYGKIPVIGDDILKMSDTFQKVNIDGYISRAQGLDLLHEGLKVGAVTAAGIATAGLAGSTLGGTFLGSTALEAPLVGEVATLAEIGGAGIGISAAGKVESAIDRGDLAGAALGLVGVGVLPEGSEKYLPSAPAPKGAIQPVYLPPPQTRGYSSNISGYGGGGGFEIPPAIAMIAIGAGLYLIVGGRK